ncbi:MAG: hypothetical protein LUD82_07570, partial [Clostridiales bacterium]|nr:hypothetical protein [Clostridiales bacterium]
AAVSNTMLFKESRLSKGNWYNYIRLEAVLQVPEGGRMAVLAITALLRAESAHPPGRPSESRGFPLPSDGSFAKGGETLQFYLFYAAGFGIITA